MTAETAARWTATAALATAVTLIALALGAPPLLAVGLGILPVAGPGFIVLWRRRLSELEIARAVARAPQVYTAPHDAGLPDAAEKY